MIFVGRDRSRPARRHAAVAEGRDAAAAARANAATAFAKLPIGFEPNVGQAPASARFVARLGSAALSLGPTGVALARGGGKPVELTFLGANRQAAARGGAAAGRGELPRRRRPSRLAKARPDLRARPLRGRLSRHRRRLPQLARAARVRPRRRSGRRSRDASASASPARRSSRSESSGELQIGNALVQSKPVSYQRVGGVRKPVASSYVLGSDGTVRLRLGGYDRGLPLVIDPVLGYSTFLGSNHNDTPFGIAVDSAGSAYITGTTNSNTFPGVGPGSDPADAADRVPGRLQRLRHEAQPAGHGRRVLDLPERRRHEQQRPEHRRRRQRQRDRGRLHQLDDVPRDERVLARSRWAAAASTGS